MKKVFQEQLEPNSRNELYAIELNTHQKCKSKKTGRPHGGPEAPYTHKSYSDLQGEHLTLNTHLSQLGNP